MARININAFHEKEWTGRICRLHDYLEAADYEIIRGANHSSEPDQTEDDAIVLQINTYGSIMRQRAGKQSQTIQINKAVAKKLVDIFQENHMLD